MIGPSGISSTNIGPNHKRRYPLMTDSSIRLIPLGKTGKFAIVDEADYAEVSQYKWNFSKALGYVYRTIGHAGREYLHRFLMRPPGFTHVVDHVDGDKLNNSRRNLRICSRAENVRNSKSHGTRKTSLFKGVYRPTDNPKWIARIMLNRKGIHLGSFSNEIDAAKAYDVAARFHFGEFAKTNFTC
jgi:hypothetical protein